MDISNRKKLARYASPAYLEAHVLRNIQYRIKELYYYVYSVTQDMLDLAYKNCKGEGTSKKETAVTNAEKEPA